MCKNPTVMPSVRACPPRFCRRSPHATSGVTASPPAAAAATWCDTGCLRAKGRPGSSWAPPQSRTCPPKPPRLLHAPLPKSDQLTKRSLAWALPSTEKIAAGSGSDVLMREQGPRRTAGPRWWEGDGIPHGRRSCRQLSRQEAQKRTSAHQQVGDRIPEHVFLLPFITDNYHEIVSAAPSFYEPEGLFDW